MVKYRLSWPSPVLQGTVEVSRSKSISNRLLILSALSGGDLTIKSLSNAEDTVRLQALLQSEEYILDAGHGGTTIRFLMAYKAIQGRPCILTGSERLRQRPMSALVEALRTLGAELEYLENEGFLPVAVKGFQARAEHPELHIAADVSSQFITAMMLIGCAMPTGLTLRLSQNIVSASYIHMTLALLHQIGLEAIWTDKLIYVPPGKAPKMEIEVEADWSSASYIYGLAALSDAAAIKIPGLKLQSLQGDAITASMMERLGVQTEEFEDGLLIRKDEAIASENFEADFELCPDIAQTFAVVLSALNIPFVFRGLRTLKVKETDRTSALINELKKTGVLLTEDWVDNKEDLLLRKESGQQMQLTDATSFATYHDHRMALAFSILSIISPVCIEDPQVVEKSFPSFWSALQRLGMEISILP